MRRMKFFLIEKIQWHQEVFIKYKKPIEEVILAVDF